MIQNKMDSLAKNDIQACLTRNLCECILYFYGQICSITENAPRFLKNTFHIPEKHHLGLASLLKYGKKAILIKA